MSYKYKTLASHSKISILELATGNNNLEEWTFLPRNSIRRFNDKHDFVFEENFVVIDFDDDNTPDVLLLNLATRKKFWMNRSLIETQIKAKVDVQIVDDDENPLNLDDFSVEVSRIREMMIGTRDIEIKYQIAYRATRYEDKLILGSFKFQELV